VAEFRKIVKYVVPEITMSNPIYIYLLFDVHYFSSQCDVGLLKRTIKEIADNPRAYVIIGGDFFDAILPSDRRFDFNILPPEALENLHDLKYMNTVMIKKAIELLEPIKDKIIVYITGNHEETAARRFYLDIAGEVGEALNIPVMGYHAYIILSFLRKNNNSTRGKLRIYVHHGWGYGRLPGSKINNLLKMSWNLNADIYISGHTHDYVKHRTKYLDNPGHSDNLIEYEKVFVCVPGLKISWHSDIRESTYEERRGYSLPYVGVPRLVIRYSKNKHRYFTEVLP